MREGELKSKEIIKKLRLINLSKLNKAANDTGDFDEDVPCTPEGIPGDPLCPPIDWSKEPRPKSNLEIMSESITSIDQKKAAEIIRKNRTTFNNDLCEPSWARYIRDSNERVIDIVPKNGEEIVLYTNLTSPDWYDIFCDISNEFDYDANKTRQLIFAGLRYIINNPQ